MTTAAESARRAQELEAEEARHPLDLPVAAAKARLELLTLPLGNVDRVDLHDRHGPTR